MVASGLPWGRLTRLCHPWICDLRVDIFNPRFAHTSAPHGLLVRFSFASIRLDRESFRPRDGMLPLAQLVASFGVTGMIIEGIFVTGELQRPSMGFACGNLLDLFF